MIKPPKWEGGFLEANIKGAQIVISGEVKRKFEKETQEIIAKTKELLHTRSIYRGQAVHMDLSWYDGSRRFDVMNDSPKFMKISESKLILNAVVKFELETSIFMLIEHTKACEAHGIAIKHGALLKGTFGTGKTMTAKVIAKKCVDNGWTFIYLKQANQLASGLKMAKMYSPAVVFVEDIDTVVNNRDESMNELLNVLDGVDTKDSKIITVLTTNKPEEIEPSFLRAGRIDSIIHFSEPDAATAMEFVRTFSGEFLKDDEDLSKVGEILQGLVPAFICEAVNKAKRYTIHRTGNSDITGQMTAQDLELAAQSVKDHYAHLKPKEFTPEQILAQQVKAVNRYGIEDELESIQNIENSVG
jgi:transitional endoplasmic reticulum ATPase